MELDSKNSTKYLKLLYILMSIQIVIGFIWMFFNIRTVSLFGDTQEYIELSKSLKIDTARTIGFPFLLKLILKMGEFTKISYQIILYIFQLLVQFIGINYFINTICKLLHLSISLSKKIFVSMYLSTIPMLIFLCFSVLTDSIANTMTICFLAAINAICLMKNEKKQDYIIFVVSYIIAGLFRPEKRYELLCLAILILIFLAVRKKIKIKKGLFIFLIILITSTITFEVNNITQTKNLYGREDESIVITVLKNRVAWGHISTNYDKFSDDIKKIISYDEAVLIDSHNNNINAVLAPIVKERAGEDKCSEIYLEIGLTILKNDFGGVVYDIVEDYISFVFTPFSSYLGLYGLCEVAASWNIYCMSAKTPYLTTFYNLIGHYIFFAILILVLISIFTNKRNRFYSIIKNNIIISLILEILLRGAVFSFPFGAPPNDRYALIVYVIWAFIVLICFPGVLPDISPYEDITKR